MTHPDSNDLLARLTHAVLTVWTGVPGERDLAVLAAPAWSDGAAIWVAAADDARVLRQQPACALLLSDADGRVIATARGTARVFGLHDPVGLVLRAPVMAGVLAALALRGGGAQGAKPAGAARIPLVRVAAKAVEVAAFPPAAPGPAPPLPAEVPAEVRRELSGVRDVVVLGEGTLEPRPATWSGGMALHGAQVPRGPAAVLLALSGTVLALQGDIAPDGRFSARQAQWLRDGSRGQAQVRTAAAPFVLPE